MSRRRATLAPFVGIVAMTVAMTAALSGCDGGQSTLEPVTLSSASAIRLDTPSPFTLMGSGFSQGTGSPSVTFRALSGTPFAGGTAAEAQVAATLLDDTTMTGMTPTALISGNVPIEIVAISPVGRASNALAVNAFAPLVWGLGTWGGAEWN